MEPKWLIKVYNGNYQAGEYRTFDFTYTTGGTLAFTDYDNDHKKVVIMGGTVIATQL